MVDRNLVLSLHSIFTLKESILANISSSVCEKASLVKLETLMLYATEENFM
jgi:hypothetical protein